MYVSYRNNVHHLLGNYPSIPEEFCMLELSMGIMRLDLFTMQAITNWKWGKPENEPRNCMNMHTKFAWTPFHFGRMNLLCIYMFASANSSMQELVKIATV